MASSKWSTAISLSLLFYGGTIITAQRIECPANIHGLINIDGFAASMLDSNIARGQGIGTTSAATKFIEMGLFQQSLRESISYTNDTAQKEKWEEYLQDSLASVIPTLSDVSNNTGFPLDRLSIGSNMIRQYLAKGNESFLPAISALSESVSLQPRNENGGLWYYANPTNLSAYHNLSYIDGMHAYPPFAVLSHDPIFNQTDVPAGSAAALEQLEILRNITRRDDGLLVHGYDASKEHSWADPTTGASPAVWARALAWYTLGTLETLELMHNSSDATTTALKAIFKDLVRAQLTASDRSLNIEGSYGVWQVVDFPGATFAGVSNFIEASASCMTAYSFLKGVRLGLLEDEELESRAKVTGLGIYKSVLQNFWIDNGNGTSSLNGTSSVASLAGDVDFTVSVSCSCLQCVVANEEYSTMLPDRLCSTV